MTVILLAILVVYVTMVYGPIAAWLVELFPTRIRYSGVSLPYHIGNGWFGGFLPATVFAIVAATGNIYSGLWYPIAIAAFIGSVKLADEVARLLLEAWPDEVAGPLATEIHNVLTTTHGGLVTIGGVFAAYFSSSGIESLRIGLNRAYGLRERRSFWVLRLESIGFVLLSAIALVMLAFLIVLGPLLFKAAAAYVPALAPLESHYVVV
jgi:hypothetical protein